MTPVCLLLVELMTPARAELARRAMYMHILKTHFKGFAKNSAFNV